MKCVKIAGLLCAVTLASGCATGLNSMQEREYRAMQSENVLVQEKNPTTGAVLGILPGGGSFYAREPALGIVNLLFWPLSILWDPISGRDGSMAINYDLSKQKLKRDLANEMSELDNQLTLGQITNVEYVAEKRKVEKKYDFQ